MSRRHGSEGDHAAVTLDGCGPAEVMRPANFASVFMLSSIFAGAFEAGKAIAAPQCDVPHPPPVCGQKDPPDPVIPPPVTLKQPQLAGSGLYADTVYNVYVRPNDADKFSVARLYVEIAHDERGPWARWIDMPVGPATPLDQPPFYVVNYRYEAPMPRTCYRAMFLSGGGNASPWSVAKCAVSAPLATNVFANPVLGNASSVPVGWTDNSTHDVKYYVQTSERPGGQAETQIFAGDGGKTGWRSVSVARRFASPTVCVSAWAAELDPPLSGVVDNLFFQDSTPMNSAINPTSMSCFNGPAD